MIMMYGILYLLFSYSVIENFSMIQGQTLSLRIITHQLMENTLNVKQLTTVRPPSELVLFPK